MAFSSYLSPLQDHHNGYQYQYWSHLHGAIERESATQTLEDNSRESVHEEPITPILQSSDVTHPSPTLKPSPKLSTVDTFKAITPIPIDAKLLMIFLRWLLSNALFEVLLAAIFINSLK